MPTIADPLRLQELKRRLLALDPGAARRFGTLTPAEMVCHLGDAAASVVGRPGGEPGPKRSLAKWLALRSPIPWPRGARTPPHIDPRAGGTKPTDFESDRRRAILGLTSLANAPAEALPSAHGRFGAMNSQDWGYWAYRHTDHHLRQFGL